jgi:hypothetical protein
MSMPLQGMRLYLAITYTLSSVQWLNTIVAVQNKGLGVFRYNASAHEIFEVIVIRIIISHSVYTFWCWLSSICICKCEAHHVRIPLHHTVASYCSSALRPYVVLDPKLKQSSTGIQTWLEWGRVCCLISCHSFMSLAFLYLFLKWR